MAAAAASALMKLMGTQLGMGAVAGLGSYAAQDFLGDNNFLNGNEAPVNTALSGYDQLMSGQGWSTHLMSDPTGTLPLTNGEDIASIASSLTNTTTPTCGQDCYARCKQNDDMKAAICKELNARHVAAMKQFGCAGVYCKSKSAAKTCSKRSSRRTVSKRNLAILGSKRSRGYQNGVGTCPYKASGKCSQGVCTR